MAFKRTLVAAEFFRVAARRSAHRLRIGSEPIAKQIAAGLIRPAIGTLARCIRPSGATDHRAKTD
jgi:hypothetical protein